MSKPSFTVLLSASVPSEGRSQRYFEEYLKVNCAQTQIEEAVIGLARNVFQVGGRLVFGGHPSISPLITMVATEYKIDQQIESMDRKEPSEKPISIFQSEAFREYIPDETMVLFNLGYSNIIWTKAVNHERFNPELKGQLQCKKSLHDMRMHMMREDIDALVCIGGMDGVEEEFEMFRRDHLGKSIFILGSTGGASKILAEKFVNSENVKVMDNMDKRFLEGGNEDFKTQSPEEYKLFDLIPYSYFTALIVQDILDSKNRNRF
jgi:hypothetical protein